MSLVKPDVPSLYRSDVFNIADILTSILLLIALSLEHSHPHSAAILCSLASITAWYRLLRVLTLSASLGPLVLSVWRALVLEWSPKQADEPLPLFCAFSLSAYAFRGAKAYREGLSRLHHASKRASFRPLDWSQCSFR